MTRETELDILFQRQRTPFREFCEFFVYLDAIKQRALNQAASRYLACLGELRHRLAELNFANLASGRACRASLSTNLASTCRRLSCGSDMSILTTQAHLHAHIALKTAALAKLQPHNMKRPGRFEPEDRLLAFLDAL